MGENLLVNDEFKDASLDMGLPAHWTRRTPRLPLTPGFGWQTGALSIDGAGNPAAFGYWSQRVPVQEGLLYELSVTFETDGIEDVALNVLNLIGWLKEDGMPQDCPHDHVSGYVRQGNAIIGRDTFRAPAGTREAEVQLGLRYSGQGRVIWRRASLSVAGRRQPRSARVSAVQWNPYADENPERFLDALSRLIDDAGHLGSDLLLLPEYVNRFDRSRSFESLAESVPDGPTCRLLSRKARENAMHLCAALLERDGDLLYNTAVLFDRTGRCEGTYRKSHLYWPEAFHHGVTPGDEYPVFDLDIGRVGIVVCYDNWYAETARLLALKGAELILFPNEGYEPSLMPARAIDNRVCVAVSSLEMPAAILDAKGDVLCSAAHGMVTADLDLGNRPSPYPVAGGTLNSSAGGRRTVRNTISDRLTEELARETRSWEARPESFLWEEGWSDPPFRK